MNMRSHCPINYALELFGDKWSLLVIRDLMFKGMRHYNQFLESEERVSTNILGDRLRSLERAGLISRRQDTTKRSRIKYSLTEKGIDLLPALMEIIYWSGIHDTETALTAEFMNKLENSRESMLESLRMKLIAEHLE